MPLPIDTTPWNKTDEEIENFLYLSKLIFDKPDGNFNFATNFQILKNNLITDENYIDLLAQFIKFLLTRNNQSTIVNDIINSMLYNKIMLEIDNSNLIIGNSITQEINGNIYRINRDSAYQITITVDNLPEWNPENVVVFIKNSDGTQISNIIINTSTTNIQIYSEDQFIYGTGIYRIYLT